MPVRRTMTHRHLFCLVLVFSLFLSWCGGGGCCPVMRLAGGCLGPWGLKIGRPQCFWAWIIWRAVLKCAGWCSIGVYGHAGFGFPGRHFRNAGCGGSAGRWAMLPDYAASPNRACLRKGHWGARLSILCLLGDQWGDFFFFEDVEKKVGLKSPKLHTPR